MRCPSAIKQPPSFRKHLQSSTTGLHCMRLHKWTGSILEWFLSAKHNTNLPGGCKYQSRPSRPIKSVAPSPEINTDKTRGIDVHCRCCVCAFETDGVDNHLDINLEFLCLFSSSTLWRRLATIQLRAIEISAWEAAQIKQAHKMIPTACQ